MDDGLKKLRISFSILLGTLVIAILGYHYLEGMSFGDAIYMTVITISTVGFGEVQQLSPAGRVITILLIAFGITIGAYALGTFIRMLIEGELRRSFGRKKVEKEISKLRNHIIVCGFGRIGSRIARELSEHGADFVVIEMGEDAIVRLEGSGYLFLPMDASDEEALEKAGIEHARAIVTAVHSDADNVFITLTAKGLRPDIFILARASSETNESKLFRAGASRVVSPYLIGGKRMAQVILRPTVVDFIDIAVMEGRLGLVMDETRVSAESKLVGKNLIESNLRRDYGVIIVLIKKFNGEMKFNPQPTELIDANDVIVVLGKREAVEQMNREI